MATKKSTKPKATENPAKAAQKEPDTTGKSIDERMADLLADHKRMGSR